MTRPPRGDIAAPELPPRVRWLNSEPGSMAELTAAGPVLVHFFDFAQLNSVRALPYVNVWHQRYAPHGLAVLGIHSPRFPFTATAEAVAGGIEPLAVSHPVALDSSYAIWHDYGAKGWPSLFLWGQGGSLAWFHLGEGEYRATEEVIQAELRAASALLELPPPLAPLRASDAPGAGVVPPTDELFPGGGPGEPWRAERDGDTIELEYAAGGAFAAVAGEGLARVSLDGAPEHELAVRPGLLTLAEHDRHEAHRLRIGADRGVEIYAISFPAQVP